MQAFRPYARRLVGERLQRKPDGTSGLRFAGTRSIRASARETFLVDSAFIRGKREPFHFFFARRFARQFMNVMAISF
jgi:hypothetical protein